MASAKVTYQSGNKLVVLRTNNDEPIAITPEEAKEISQDLSNLNLEF